VRASFVRAEKRKSRARPGFGAIGSSQGRLPNEEPVVVLGEPPAVTELPELAAAAADCAAPAPRPPLRPVPGCDDWPALPEPVVPGTASPPDEPVCGIEPASPDEPPGGLSGAAGFTTSVPLPVPGRPGATALFSACLLHAPSASAQAAARVTRGQERRIIDQREVPAVPLVPVEPVVPVPVVLLVLPVVPVALPGVEDVVVSVLEPVVPPAPIVVPPPVAEPLVLGVVLAVLPVEPMLPDVEPVPPLAAVLLVVSLGDVVVEGVVLELDEVAPAPASSCFLLQALSDSAAINASAAHCAIGDLIIRNSLNVGLMPLTRAGSGSRCLRLTLVGAFPGRVVSYCRTL
jgi:hypothetical protein